jgi:hypothetical protein
VEDGGECEGVENWQETLSEVAAAAAEVLATATGAVEGKLRASTWKAVALMAAGHPERAALLGALGVEEDDDSEVAREAQAVIRHALL